MLTTNTQYSLIASNAIQLMRSRQLSSEEAWLSAAKTVTNSEASQQKGCPKASFIGLCDHGFIRGIKGSRQYQSKNFRYAAYAIQLWKGNPNLSKKEVWQKVQTHFGTTASHQSQLNVVVGLWDELA